MLTRHDVQVDEAGLGELGQRQPNGIVAGRSQASLIEGPTHLVDVVGAVTEIEHERSTAIECARLIALGIEDQHLVVDRLDQQPVSSCRNHPGNLSFTQKRRQQKRSSINTAIHTTRGALCES